MRAHACMCIDGVYWRRDAADASMGEDGWAPRLRVIEGAALVLLRTSKGLTYYKGHQISAPQ